MASRDRDYPRKVSKRALDIAADEPTYRSRRKMTRVNLFGQKEASAEDDSLKILKAYESQQIKDPFSAQYTNTIYATGVNNILPPPYNPYALMRFPIENNTLRQCIDAMVINIEAMGHRFEYIGPEGGEEAPEALSEKYRLEALVTQPNGEYGILELRERRRRDFETFGYCFLEVCRGTYKNDIVSYYHVPAETIRLTAADAEETPYMVWLFREEQYVQQKVMRRFRRFVQEIGTRRVYFKEFGDPRAIDSTTGMPYDGVDASRLATELVFNNIYSPGSPYGMPRYINQLPAIMGSRESELTNLQFFKENAIPAMAVCVSGGHLTADSVDEIEEHIYSVQGRNAQHRVMILEAEADNNASSPDGASKAPKLELIPLAKDRQSDGLFQEYDKNNSAKVRSSFRLNPLLLGMSQDVTYAVAEASMVVAEGQVFGPERNKIDDIFNQQILSDATGKPPLFWRFRSQAARISDPQMIINALITFDRVGALTPNIVIGIANEMFDLDMEIIDDVWGNYPFDITIGLLRQGQLVGMDEVVGAMTAIVNPNAQAAPGWPVLGPGSESPPGVTKTAKELLIAPLQKLIDEAGLAERGYKERARDGKTVSEPLKKKVQTNPYLAKRAEGCSCERAACNECQTRIEKTKDRR